MPSTKEADEQDEIIKAPALPEVLVTTLRTKENCHLAGAFVPKGTTYTFPKAQADELLATTDFYEVA